VASLTPRPLTSPWNPTFGMGALSSGGNVLVGSERGLPVGPLSGNRPRLGVCHALELCT
jgi:hypothetical protein